ncbi:MAG: beta-CASP ribonuclease aCPSF1 [Candidatus Hydrothermarchaeota archaeon]
MGNDLLADVKLTLSDTPEGSTVTDVQFEGPEIVVYSKSPFLLMDNGEIIRQLAKDIRKRIVIRPDPSVLADPEEAKTKIKQVVPEEAEMTNVTFDPNTGDVIIEAKKPGLVIGKHGKTLRNITREIGWRPRVVRTPPIPSTIIQGIRTILQNESEERREILHRVGKKIHRTDVAENEWIRSSFLGGFREVGRTSILLHTPNTKAMIDCGVNVAVEDNNLAYPRLDLPEARILDELDAVIVSHAHLDHCGFVPYLFKFGYDGPVYCTSPTRDLMVLLQMDYIDVAQKENKHVPYGKKEIKEVIKHSITLDYGVVTDIAPDMRLTLHNAGHILGSSIVHLHIGDGFHNVVFTGDFKFEKTRLFQPAHHRFPRVETLIMEGTYGGSEDIMPPRQEAEKELIKTISDTVKRGGKVLIPVFAVGRAQEIMIVLGEYIRLDILEEIPIYLDGMIWDATAIHTTYPEFLSNELREKIFHQGENPFLSDVFEKVSNQNERDSIIEGEPCVVLATSGMLTGGPSVEYFLKWCEDPKNSIIFVGYQAEGSLGRRVQKGWKEISTLDEDHKIRVIEANIDVHTIDGFSGHSDRNQLINFVKAISPKPERVLIGHGENNKCIKLASWLHKHFRIETFAPQNFEILRFK